MAERPALAAEVVDAVGLEQAGDPAFDARFGRRRGARGESDHQGWNQGEGGFHRAWKSGSWMTSRRSERTPPPRLFRPRRDRVEGLAVAERGLSASRVDEPLPGEILQQDRPVIREPGLQLADVTERPAVGQDAARVDRRAEPEADPDERVDLAAWCGVALFERAIPRPEPADNVIALQREPGRVDPGVAAGAARIVAVPGQ